MANLTSIRIKNYRSIRDSGDVQISKLFALIGKNNTGKSSFLKAIQVLLGEIKEIEASDFHKGTADSIEISGKVDAWVDDQKTTKEYRVICANSEKLKPKYYIDGQEKPFTSYSGSAPPLLVIPDRRDSAEFTTAGQRTSLLKKILTERKTVDSARLNTLSAELEDLKRSEAATVSELLTKRFRSIAQEQTFEVKIEPEIDVAKSTTHTSALVDNDIPNAPTVGLTESGTGIQSLFLLALLDVYGDISDKSEEGILLIEEPEVYLHPEYQRRMFEAMRKIAAENQVIFSTHSPIMISQIWLTESVRQVRLVSGETQVESVKVEQVIAELGIRYEDVLNPKLTIFVEGESDISFFKKLGISSVQIAFIVTDSFRAMHYFAYMKIISSVNVSSTFVVITDSDGEAPATRIEDLRSTAKSQFDDSDGKLASRLDEAGVIRVLDQYAIESYLIDSDTLTRAFPDLEAQQVGNFVNHYHTIYKAKLAEVRAGTLSLEKFKKHAKPKLIFDRSERKHYTNPAFIADYNGFWGNDANFESVRENILIRCEAIGGRGESWFEHVLSHADLLRFPELVQLRDEILALVA